MYKLLFVVLLAIAASAEKVDYSGHMVITVVPQTQEQLDLLVELQRQGHDFWDGPAPLGLPSDIRVSPQSYYHVARSMALLNLSHKIKFTDVGKMFADNEKEINLRRATHDGKAFDFLNFHPYEEIEAYLKELDASSELVSVSSIGKTLDDAYDIWMAKISPNQASTTRKQMYFECAMHAREWSTPAGCLWFMNELVTKYGSDAEITELVDYADWLIVPVSNPAGYNHTWKADRNWRKNREPNSGSPCIGTDPNRNFDANWNGPGAGDTACSDTYRGPSVFSSREAQAMRDILTSIKDRLVAEVTIHSFSQYWMHPYGYQQARAADYDEMYRVAGIAVRAVRATHGKVFQYGPIFDVIYQASGSTVDWVYDKLGVVYTYALELRDTGAYGFVMPVSEILPSSEELFAGLKAMVKEVKAKKP